MQGNGTLVPIEARALQRALFRDIAKDVGYTRPASKYTGATYIKVDYIAAFLAADPAHASAFHRLATATEVWMCEADQDRRTFVHGCLRDHPVSMSSNLWRQVGGHMYTDGRAPRLAWWGTKYPCPENAPGVMSTFGDSTCVGVCTCPCYVWFG